MAAFWLSKALHYLAILKFLYVSAIQWASKSLLPLGLPIKQIALAALDGAPLADLDVQAKGGDFEVVSLQAAAQFFALAALLCKSGFSKARRSAENRSILKEWGYCVFPPSPQRQQCFPYPCILPGQLQGREHWQETLPFFWEKVHTLFVVKAVFAKGRGFDRVRNFIDTLLTPFNVASLFSLAHVFAFSAVQALAMFKSFAG